MFLGKKFHDGLFSKSFSELKKKKMIVNFTFLPASVFSHAKLGLLSSFGFTVTNAIAYSGAWEWPIFTILSIWIYGLTLSYFATIPPPPGLLIISIAIYI